MSPMIEFPLDIPESHVLKTELKKRQFVITVEGARPLCDLLSVRAEDL